MSHNDIKQPQVIINNNTFYLEIADTQIKREKWLMWYEKLEKNKWMLFVFEDEDYYSFWMKGTLIPLDIIWINKNLKVIDLVSAYPPQNWEILKTYTPRNKCLRVLEINGWLAKKNWIKIWDSVEFKNLQEDWKFNQEFLTKYF